VHIQEETELIKEKLRDIQKITNEIDKKIDNAQILEIYANHSEEDSMKELKQFRKKIIQVKTTQKVQKIELEQKCRDIEKMID
jgi:flavorubredoxin